MEVKSSNLDPMMSRKVEPSNMTGVKVKSAAIARLDDKWRLIVVD